MSQICKHRKREPEYDGFQYPGITRVIALSEAVSPNGDLLEQYNRATLFCPDCGLARLTFRARTSSRTEHLQTKKSAAGEINRHDTQCPHQFLPASRKQITKYYSSLTNAQVQDRFDAIMRLLAHRRNMPQRNVLVEDAVNAFSMLTSNDKGPQTRKRLPSKRVDNIHSINDDYFGIPILIYGTVRLSTDSTTYDSGITVYKLNLWKEDGSKIITSLYRKRVEDIVNIESLYQFVCIAIPRQIDKKRKGFDLYEPEPGAQALRIERID